MGRIKIIGAGLAGSECAFQLAGQGHQVDLFEMRPMRKTAAHQSDRLAELVCSNSFRSSNITNAVGLLKHEMQILQSLVMSCAGDARIPAGDAFAVDREKFAESVTAAIAEKPGIRVLRQEVSTLDLAGYEALVVATGPLTSDLLFQAVNDFLGRD